jgi:hypothetical protein
MGEFTSTEILIIRDFPAGNSDVPKDETSGFDRAALDSGRSSGGTFRKTVLVLPMFVGLGLMVLALALSFGPLMLEAAGSMSQAKMRRRSSSWRNAASCSGACAPQPQIVAMRASSRAR